MDLGTAESNIGEKNLSALNALFDLGEDLCKQENKDQEAETIFMSIYQEFNTNLGHTGPDLEQLALRSGQKLAITQSRQQGRTNIAINTIRAVFSARQNAQKQDERATIESGRLLGLWLTEQRNFIDAEAVLRRLWACTITPPLESEWLKVGDSLGQCLARQSHHRQSREILGVVMHHKRSKYGVDSAEYRTTLTHW